MKRRYSRWLGVVIGWLVLSGLGLQPSQIHAAQPEYQMDQMVVTASKVPESKGNVTQKIEVITLEETDSMVLTKGNLIEILQYQPGMAPSILSRNDANWGAAGGIGPKYTMYMLDGLPIDGFVDPQALDPWILDRIETQRGPASVLYPNYLFMDFAGNQSPLAGTTNLILPERFGAPETRLMAGYGSYDTLSTKFFHGRDVDHLSLFAGGFYENSDYTNYGTTPSWLNMIDDPEYEKTKLYVGGVYRINGRPDHKLSLFANRYIHDGDAGRPNRDFDHRYSIFQGSYALPLTDSLSSRLAVGYRDYDRSWEEDQYPNSLALRSQDGVKQTIIPADISFALRHGDAHLFTFGGDYQHATYQTYSETDHVAVGNDADASQAGIYAQEEFRIADLTLRFGGRFTEVEHDIHLLGGNPPGDDSASWNKWLWSAGARYKFNSMVTAYTNVGTSFLAPSLKSVGGTLKLSDKGVPGKNGQLPNPDLKPETGIGYDLGTDIALTKSVQFGVRGFLNRIDDQIVENAVVSTPTTSQSQSVNAGKTTAYGVETEVKWRLNKDISAFANYTYTHSEIDNDIDPDQDGAEVPFAPAHMGNIGVSANLGWGVSASAWLHVSGKIYDSTSLSGRKEFSGYETLNAHVEKAVYEKEVTRVSVYVDLYNLTNREYEMPWQFQDPGFAAMAGLKAVF